MNECFGRAIFVIRVPSLIHETKGSSAGYLRYCSVGSFASLNVASYVGASQQAGWCTPRRVPSPGHARSGGRRGLYMRVNKAFSNIASPFAFKFTSEGDGGGGGSYSSHYMEVSLDKRFQGSLHISWLLRVSDAMQRSSRRSFDTCSCGSRTAPSRPRRRKTEQPDLTRPRVPVISDDDISR